jgi:hypothetical protein
MQYFIRLRIGSQFSRDQSGLLSLRAELPKAKHHIAQMVSSSEHLADRWREAVTEYSDLKLTRKSDRLPAISGLAEIMGQLRPQSGYLAGLWRDTLFADLCWKVRKPQAARSRGPSWSWSSLEGGVSYPKQLSRWKPATSITLTEAHCISLGPKPTGQVESGFLRLSCNLFRGNLVLQLPDWTFFKSLKFPLRIPTQEAFEHARAKGLGERDAKWGTCHIQIGEGSLEFDPDTRMFEDIQRRIFDEPFYGCPILTGEYDHEGYMLILHCVDRDNRIYETIGIHKVGMRFVVDERSHELDQKILAGELGKEREITLV